VRQFVLDAEAQNAFSESVTFEAKEKKDRNNVADAVAALSNTLPPRRQRRRVPPRRRTTLNRNRSAVTSRTSRTEPMSSRVTSV